MKSQSQIAKIALETKKLVELFLKTNLSDIKLAKETGISSSTIGRRLINKEVIINVFNQPENKLTLPKDKYHHSYGEFIYDLVKQKRQHNLYKGRSKGGSIAIEKHGYVKNLKGKYTSLDKINLNEIYKDEINKYKFLGLSALTFRLKLNTLTKLMAMPDEELKQKLFYYNEDYLKALDFLFFKDKSNQKVALKNFKMFYTDLLNAIRNHNKTQVHDLIGLLHDMDFAKLKNGSKITVNDLNSVINYQLKYAYDMAKMAQLLHLSEKDYILMLKDYFEKQKTLQENYLLLVNYLLDLFRGL